MYATDRSHHVNLPPDPFAGIGPDLSPLFHNPLRDVAAGFTARQDAATADLRELLARPFAAARVAVEQAFTVPPIPVPTFAFPAVVVPDPFASLDRGGWFGGPLRNGFGDIVRRRDTGFTESLDRIAREQQVWFRDVADRAARVLSESFESIRSFGEEDDGDAVADPDTVPSRPPVVIIVVPACPDR